MAEYLSYEEYAGYGLDAIEEADFTAFAIYASRLIDAYTFNAVQRFSLLEDEYYAGLIKDAVAFQIDFMHRIGLEKALGVDATAGKELAGESETIGNYSISRTFSSDESQGGSKRYFVGTAQIASLAVTILAPVQALGRKIG